MNETALENITRIENEILFWQKKLDRWQTKNSAIELKIQSYQLRLRFWLRNVL